MVFRILIATLLSTALLQPIHAQQRRDQFARNLPAVGSQIPAAEIFDAAGQVFPTEKLKGNYTVLVFGCMT